MPKIIICTGAPTAESLNWDVPLRDEFITPISTFTGLDDPSASSAEPSQPSQTTHPQWRSIPLKKQTLHTGLTQPTDYFLHPTDFIPGTTSFTSSAAPEADGTTPEETHQEEEEDLRSQFYDHSLLLHDTTPIDEPPTSPEQDSSTFLSTSSQDNHPPYSPAPSLDPPGPCPTHRPTDLNAIPTPLSLSRLPSPRIASLITALISLTPLTAQTRFGPRQIIQALVGDDTRSGFQLTFWLPSGPSPLGTALASLRRGDVVLVQGIQLAVFRGRVYGQSVRGGGTRVYLLYRSRLDGDGRAAGHYRLGDLAVPGEVHPQLDKTRRVRKWVLEFLGGGSTVGTGWDRPPDDTQ